MNNAKISKLDGFSLGLSILSLKILHLHVLHKVVLSSDILKFREAYLGNNRTELATGSRDTMSSGAVSGREDFSRYHESCRVRSKVLEEVGEAVEYNETFRGCCCRCESIITESCARNF